MNHTPLHSVAPATTITHRGCPLAYRLRGNPTGPRLLLIQGVGLHGEGWLPQINGDLGTQCHCLTFDNRGIGESQPLNTPIGGHRYGAPITVEQLADDTRAVKDAAGWPSAHIVGHSLGGLVALHLALTARPRVQSLTLACTFANGRTATALTPRMLWLGTRSRLGPRSWRRNAFLQIIFPPDELRQADRAKRAANLAPLFGHDLADMPSVVSHQLRALRHYDATPRLAELAGIPTLVISAAHDPIARPAAAGRPLATSILGARYVEFPNASHGLPIQIPGEFNRLLLNHISANASR